MKQCGHSARWEFYSEQIHKKQISTKFVAWKTWGVLCGMKRELQPKRKVSIVPGVAVMFPFCFSSGYGYIAISRGSAVARHSQQTFLCLCARVYYPCTFLPPVVIFSRLFVSLEARMAVTWGCICLATEMCWVWNVRRGGWKEDKDIDFRSVLVVYWV